MNVDAVPIERFIDDVYKSRIIQKIVSSWDIEPAQVRQSLVRHFRDMGIYSVNYTTTRVVAKNVEWLLRDSPEIKALLTRVRRDDALKRRTRHAD